MPFLVAHSVLTTEGTAEKYMLRIEAIKIICVKPR